jgi:nucleotide-binding universal stress UspA family protein
MKKILVPTDFSENANHALNFAIAISNRFEADIVLYHVYRIGTSAAEKFKSTVDEIVREDKMKALEESLEKARPTLENGSLQGQIARGDIEDLIVDKAKKEKFDLIVMGSEGETGLGTLLFGSTSQEVTRRSSVPVVVIPQGAEPRHIQNIVLAVDGQGISSPDLLSPLVELARLRNAKIQVFHKIMKEEDKESAELHPSIAQALEGLDYTYHCEETDTDDISDSIKEFVEAHHGHLLCLIHRHKGLFARLFKEKVTRDSVTDNAIPLLIIAD